MDDHSLLACPCVSENTKPGTRIFYMPGKNLEYWKAYGIWKLSTIINGRVYARGPYGWRDTDASDILDHWRIYPQPTLDERINAL